MNDCPETTLPHDQSQRLWDDVSERLQRFIDAWEESEAPTIAEFLPPGSGDARAFALVEMIKIDIEQRWQRDCQPRSLDDYCCEYPELSETGVPLDLVYEEFHLRRQHGDDVCVEDYLKAYSDQATELRRMLQVDRPFETTSLHRCTPHFDFAAGDVVDDFELVAQIGKGAFAAVFLARQRSMQRMVALKISSDRGCEPQTLARLDHPYIVRIYDQRQLAESNLRLLYMQYVRGGTLLDALNRLRTQPNGTWNGARFLAAVDAVLESRGADIPHDSSQRQQLASISWPEVVALLGCQLAEALEYAHRQGVLHRDLKPANILLSNSASPKLVDFNVSSCSKVEGASPTAYFGGSLAYMSPEQMRACNPRCEETAESLDGRSDVFALGVVLWELLTGFRPFDDSGLREGWGSTVDELLDIRSAGVGERNCALWPADRPPGLRDALLGCLQHDPADRFQTAGQLADQLRLCRTPHAYRLLSPPVELHRKLIGRAPVLMMVLAVLIPHAVAGWFNYTCNYDLIIKPSPEWKGAFHSVALLINGIAFPAGLAIGLWIISSVALQVGRRFRDGSHQLAPARLRRRCLRLGHYLALLSIAEWSLAGIAFPLAMMWAGSPLSGSQMMHFFGSMLLCGLISAAYPFFNATVICVNVWYPALLRPQVFVGQDREQYDWLEKASSWYLVLAAAVPLVALACLSTLLSTGTRWLMATISLGGLVVFALVFYLWRRIQSDLNTIRSLGANQEFPGK